MAKKTDVKITAAELFFLPIQTRLPLKFGAETVTHVTCARVRLEVASASGQRGWGWGETPLSVAWVWPGKLSYEERQSALEQFCVSLCRAWAQWATAGHPMEISQAFQSDQLPALLSQFNQGRAEPMPWLAALVCCSAFDIALHDAYGIAHQISVYQTYNDQFMNVDLAAYMTPADIFEGRYPEDFMVHPSARRLPAWHLVGGKDLIDAAELDGSEPDDGYPVLLADWIERDGLKCLKVKLRGDDAAWDYQRLIEVGGIAVSHEVDWLTSDFNCMVTEPAYVNDILDRLLVEHPRLYGMLLYVEQPFPYELEEYAIDVHSVAARKPLFMDESAHDWRLVEVGRKLGWTGVALKTCKTQTGALLSLCWAKAHGMTLMVQDLTNPMLAQIPHLLLAAHAGTIMGVETNSMQFYPEASAPEEVVHPNAYRRVRGQVDIGSATGPGFGYRVEHIERQLPEPAASS